MLILLSAAYFPQYIGLAEGKWKKMYRMSWAELKSIMSHMAREDVKVRGGASSSLSPEG